LSENKLNLCFKLGFSHVLFLSIPSNIINIIIDKTFIILESDDLLVLGNFCKKIKQLKLPDIYKGKGFSYKNQKLILKSIKKK
jgi:ribosomal protein L6P/L9E